MKNLTIARIPKSQRKNKTTHEDFLCQTLYLWKFQNALSVLDFSNQKSAIEKALFHRDVESAAKQTMCTQSVLTNDKRQSKEVSIIYEERFA